MTVYTYLYLVILSHQFGYSFASDALTVWNALFVEIVVPSSSTASFRKELKYLHKKGMPLLS